VAGEITKISLPHVTVNQQLVGWEFKHNLSAQGYIGDQVFSGDLVPSR